MRFAAGHESGMGTSRRAVHLADLGFVHFNDFASAAQRHDADNLHGPAMCAQDQTLSRHMVKVTANGHVRCGKLGNESGGADLPIGFEKVQDFSLPALRCHGKDLF